MDLKQYIFIILGVFIVDFSLAESKESAPNIPMHHSTHRIEPKHKYTHHQWIRHPNPYKKQRKFK